MYVWQNIREFIQAIFHFVNDLKRNRGNNSDREVEEDGLDSAEDWKLNKKMKPFSLNEKM